MSAASASAPADEPSPASRAASVTGFPPAPGIAASRSTVPPPAPVATPLAPPSEAPRPPADEELALGDSDACEPQLASAPAPTVKRPMAAPREIIGSSSEKSFGAVPRARHSASVKRKSAFSAIAGRKSWSNIVRMRIHPKPATFLAVFTLMVGLVLARGAAAAKGAKPPAAAASAPAAQAQEAPSDDEPSPSEPRLPWQNGPTKVDLGHELALDLKGEHRFLASGPAAKVMEKMGNFHNDNLLGVVTSRSGEDWFAVLRYEAEGYIKDDETIDANELLSAIREGTDEANKERVEKGFKALRIDGWSEAPRYEKAAHHLVWALEVSDDEGKSVNYNTRILGRRGYVSINLVTSPQELAGFKPQASVLLASTKFSNGARYEDFDSKTDKVAEYGLAGLVLGGAGLAAAKLVKVGLLAKFSKVIIAALIAGKKAIIAAAIAVVALVKKFFGQKKSEAAGPPA
jgi:uncharacterized membrane-anchored protein